MSDEYYNQLAPYYKFVYLDWEASIQRQANLLDNIIREFIGQKAHSVLDAGCGIGTQSIGLSCLGYEVTASDLSPGEVERARQEAKNHAVEIKFSVADMRQLWQAHQAQFDVVMACDNVIPHLLTDREILLTFQQFYKCTKDGGGCLISVRDYEKTQPGGKQLNPRHVHETADGRILLFDLWEFDGSFYDLTTYIVEDTGQTEAKTKVVRGGRYYCVTIPTLKKLMEQAGFKNILMLQDRFFQPVILGLKV
jgi:SAM-dependent methyltransferase